VAGKSPRESVAHLVRERVLGSRERIWRVEDFAGTPKAVNNELRRLVERGQLQRIRRGVYWRGRMSRFGMHGADDGETVQTIVGRDEAIGATGWNATNILGLSTQVSPIASLAVTHRVPEGLGRIKVVSRTARTGRRKAGLSGLEVTVLEALEGWDRYIEVGPAEAVRRFDQILRHPDVRIPKLISASTTEPPVVRERLRAVLAETGHQAESQRIPRARDQRTRDKALRVLEGRE
jgi:Family of unknown function (DUF6088)